MSIVQLANDEPHNHLTVPEFGTGPGGNINLAITRTTTTIVSLPAGQIQPINPLMPVNFFPNSHSFKMNPYYSSGTHTNELSDKMPCDLRTSTPTASSSSLANSNELSSSNLNELCPLPLNVISGSELMSSTTLPSRAISSPTTLNSSRLSTAAPLNGVQYVPTSSDSSESRVRNKSREPKYRSTKRPPSDRKFKCDHCESRFFTQKDVKRHLVVHTGVRNFACPFCSQRFGRKDHMVRHAKKSHNQDTRSFRRKNAAAVRAAALSVNLPVTNSGSTVGNRRTGVGRGRRKKDSQNAVALPTLSGSNSTLVGENDISGQNTVRHHHYYHHHYNHINESTTASNYPPTSFMPPSSFYPPNGSHNTFDAPQTRHLMSSSMPSGTHYVTNGSIGASALAALSKTQFAGSYHSSTAYEHPGTPASAFQYNRRPHQLMMDASSQQYPFHFTSSSASAFYPGTGTNGFHPASQTTVPDPGSVAMAQLAHSASITTESGATSLIPASSAGNDVSFKSLANSVVEGFNACLEPEYLQSHGPLSSNLTSTANSVNLAQLNPASLHSTSVPGSGGLEGRYF